MSCLDANLVQDLMSGALDAGQRGAVLAHLDVCGECRELLTISARVALRADATAGALLDTVASLGDRPTEDALAATALPSDVATHPGPASVARPAQGRRFGRYQLHDRLGAGAMGVVWLAEDPELRRKLAVKLLKRPDALLTERLVREAQSMARVNHPNVAAVYDVGVAEGATYIAMELISGGSLRAWQSGARHTIPDIVEQYLAAGRGLAAAHARGVVHRDFKPDNVLIGEDRRVRVTDFGLAAARAGESGSHAAVGDVHLTTDGSVLGTPAYMAPEQFTGGNVEPRTDQFCFCVALYEALYGQRPFEGKSFEELGDHVCAGRVRPAPAGSRVSGALRAILLRGLSVEVGDRYPTMDHLLAELGRDRARPWRRAAIASVAIASALVLGLVADWVVRGRIEDEVRQSFRLTGTQIERVGVTEAKKVEVAPMLARELPVMVEVTSHRDQADFGLATPEQDSADLQGLHDMLLSADWKQIRELDTHPTEIAVVDYKGRVLYSSAARPDDWKREVIGMPAIRTAIEQGQSLLSTVRYDAPELVRARLFSARPVRGLAVMFVRALEHAGERGGAFLQFIDGQDVLDAIKLDSETRLGLVADGPPIGDVPQTLVDAAPAGGDLAEVTEDGKTYLVQARPLADAGGRRFATVVMARVIDSVLALFPHARAVFALAAAFAIAAALATMIRARSITGARV
jgi:predicted Ser/Thr protein kinase